MDERRQHKRLPARIEIQFDNLPALKIAYSRDISKGGLFFFSETELPRDDVFEFSLALPKQDKWIKLKGKIVHVHPMGDGNFGIGVEFFELDAALRGQIAAIVADIDENTATQKPPAVRFVFDEAEPKQPPKTPAPKPRAKATQKKQSTTQKKRKPTNTSSSSSLEKMLLEVEKRARKKSFFEILSVTESDDRKAIRNAYHRFCNEFHPDLMKGRINPSQLERVEKVFNKVTLAYKTLRSSKSREAHLQELQTQKSSVARMHIKQKEQFLAQNKDKVEQAARLYEQALESIEEGKNARAINNLKLAVSLHPLEAKYKNKLQELSQGDQD